MNELQRIKSSMTEPPFLKGASQSLIISEVCGGLNEASVTLGQAIR